MANLPIDALRPQVEAALRVPGSNLVVVAPPGTGKTTRVPLWLTEGAVGAGQVWVLQPRRLAARMAATRMAAELGEPVGQRIGYQVRFDERVSSATRIRFVTEGLLLRRLLASPALDGIDVVVLDEFHERHLASDLALAVSRRLQAGPRPDLRLLAMSATLDTGPLATFLGDCPVARAEGRAHRVDIVYAPSPPGRPLADAVATAVRSVLDDLPEGDVLVFLPGAGEIARARVALLPAAAARSLEVLPLHGEMPAADQDRALLPTTRRKVILATNVAETSITVPGIVAVVDSGLARIASCDPWSGLSTLAVQPISRAAAEQRAGRAGRTRDGRCVRLYARSDFEGRRAFEVPEVRRADLAEEVLLLRGLGVDDPASFPFFEAPAAAALEAAALLLARLSAIDSTGALTPRGGRMLALPLHPRLSRLLVESVDRGVPEEGATVAALLQERDILARDGPPVALHTSSSDVLDRFDALTEASHTNFRPERLRALGLHPAAVQAVHRTRSQLVGLLERGRAGGSGRPATAEAREQALSLAVLVAFPDRVARRRSGGPRGAPSDEVLLCQGGTARMDPRSAVRDAPFLVAVAAEGRFDGGRGVPRVTLASSVEAEGLLEAFPDALVDVSELTWNEETERVESVRGLRYGCIAVDETRRPVDRAERPAASRLLEEAALRAGWRRFADPERVATLSARYDFARRVQPVLPPSGGIEADMASVLRAACAGRVSFAELREVPWLEALRGAFPPGAAATLDRLAPETITLAGGRRLTVHYETDRPPWVESRLQDFFGMHQGPTVAAGRVPVVLHLLAPNQRAVQVTTDLPGFWSRHYPKLKQELKRRYPRHAWPDDPTTAPAPGAGTRRP